MGYDDIIADRVKWVNRLFYQPGSIYCFDYSALNFSNNFS